MPVDRVVELVALGVARGSLYALIAAGFALVFGAGRVLNLFHGSFFLLGAYAAFAASSMIGRDAGYLVWLLTDLAVAGAVGVLALAYYYLVLRPCRDSWVRLVTVGLASNLVVAEAFKVGYGTRSAYVPPVVPGTLEWGTVSLLRQEGVVVGVTAMILILLGLLLSRSLWGKAIRAVAQDQTGARLVGIDPATTLALTVALSGMLAGLAGALAAPLRVVRPDMWSFALLKALTVVIVGGIGSLRGTCVAAYGLGFMEVVATAWFGETASELTGVLVALVVLTLRPRGVVADA